jgi:hypothetical protein
VLTVQADRVAVITQEFFVFPAASEILGLTWGFIRAYNAAGV